MNRSVIAAALAAVLILGAAGCSSAPKAIPESLSVQEIVQRAQEANDDYNYKAAVAYYQAALDRFGTDPAILCMGEYEIAFIYYKQDKFAESKALFTRLLERYAGPDAANLPSRYQFLAEKVLPKVEEGLSKK